MREKLKTLPLVQLREMAKAQGLKGISTLKKAEIIDRLCELEKPAEGGQKEETPQASVSEHPAGSAEPAERTEMHVQPRRTDAGQNTSAQTYSQPRRSANGERAAGGQNSSYERRSEGGYRRNEYGSYTRRYRSFDWVWRTMSRSLSPRFIRYALDRSPFGSVSSP